MVLVLENVCDCFSIFPFFSLSFLIIVRRISPLISFALNGSLIGNKVIVYTNKVSLSLKTYLKIIIQWITITVLPVIHPTPEMSEVAMQMLNEEDKNTVKWL